MKYFRQIACQSPWLFTVLALSSILSWSADITLLEAGVGDSLEPSQGVANEMLKRCREDITIPERLPPQLASSVINAVRLDLSPFSGSSHGKLGVVSSTQKIGSNTCMGLPEPDKEEVSNIGDANLPQSVADAVLQVASGQLSLPISQLQVTQVQQQTWSDRCLGLPRPIEKCIGTPTPGWQVTVEGRQQFYLYRTDSSGSHVRTEAIAGLPPHNQNLPYSVANAVLQDAQARLNLPTSELHILQAEQQVWSDTCLGLASAGKVCIQALIPGWRVTVDGKTQILLYHTNDSGSQLRSE